MSTPPTSRGRRPGAGAAPSAAAPSAAAPASVAAGVRAAGEADLALAADLAEEVLVQHAPVARLGLGRRAARARGADRHLANGAPPARAGASAAKLSATLLASPRSARR